LLVKIVALTEAKVAQLTVRLYTAINQIFGAITVDQVTCLEKAILIECCLGAIRVFKISAGCG
jgi:hypothetical protein